MRGALLTHNYVTQSKKLIWIKFQSAHLSFCFSFKFTASLGLVKERNVESTTGPLQVIIKKEEMPHLFQVMLEESCFPLELSVCWLNWSFMFQLKLNWVNRQFYQEQSRTRLSLITPGKKIENIIQYLYLSIAGLACSAGFGLHCRIQWWMLNWKNFPGNIENTVSLRTRFSCTC